MKRNDNMTSLQIKPYTLRCDEGQRLLPARALVIVKATTEQTGGTFNLFDVTCPPDYATPLHIHYAEDVAVYVLEGRLTFYWGSEMREMKEAVAGSYFFQPRGTPYGFRVAGAMPARILYMTFPAGLDRFLIEQESLSLAPELAPDSESVTAAARYKIEILEPLPE